MPFEATWMDLEIIIPSAESQIEKDKYMISHICEFFKKMIQMNLFTKQKTHLREGKNGGGRTEW